ncbi:MAG TPA: hypothetical protein VH678_24025 [Xanthobacteraceae bacterium]|jgi:hypothetical protein
MPSLDIIVDPARWTPEGVSAIATAAIAVFTIVLVWVTSRQARLTKEALIADKRAFVFAKNIFPVWELDRQTGEYNWRFRPVWENSGDTPTKGMTLYVDCELRNTILPQGFDFTRTTIPAGPGMLGPRATSTGGAAPHYPVAAITPTDIVDIQAGKKFLYLWGWVRYWDVFPKTPQHITRFCWQIMPLGNPKNYNPAQVPGAPESLNFGYLHQSEGNCADEECPQ